MNSRYELNKFINRLVKNQNMTSTPYLQDMYSKRDYYHFLYDVLLIMKQFPHASLATIRIKLLEQSGLKELIQSFVHDKALTPGLLLDFGTEKLRDTIICGNAQEVPDTKALSHDTIFDLASTSKLFTCIGILKLQEMGLIDLFAPVSSYVPSFPYLDDVTIYDLLKFRVKVQTDKRIDQAKTIEEAHQILYTAKPSSNQHFHNAYTDIGAMILRVVIENITHIPFTEFVKTTILDIAGMEDTHLIVPEDKINRVANENYSKIVNQYGQVITRFYDTPGTPHDAKTKAIGASIGIAPGHAGYFSTSKDMIKLGNALINGTIISKDSVLSISDNAAGYDDNGSFTTFYGSLVYLKQPDSNNIYLPLSGKSFISPGFAGTTLCVDPINKLNIFIGANRLHNRIYQIHPSFKHRIITKENGRKVFLLPDNSEVTVTDSFTIDRTHLLKKAIQLSIQYQFLESIYPRKKEMHLVRELN